MAICQTCGHAHGDEARYCSQCGTRFRDGAVRRDELDEGERRHCSVMFCDLMGSAALSEECGAELYRTLISLVHDTASEVIEGFGGQILQYLGDGVLVLFGYPHAHEADALRAVRAGLAVQAAIRDCALDSPRTVGFSRHLHTRAAIHTGLVVVGELGLGRQRTVLAHGDTVNIAARLQQLASEDGLIITESTRRLLNDQFAVEPLGIRTLAGIRAQVLTFRVIAETPAGTGVSRPQPGSRFIGRRRELAQLTTWWQESERATTQTIGLVSGEPGIGKSRLLAAFRASLPDGTPWLDLRGAHDYHSSELRPFLQLLEQRGLARGSDAVTLASLEAAFTLPGIDATQVAALLASRLPVRDAAGVTAPLLAPDQQRRILLASAVQWMLAHCAGGRAVVACEDLQWFDPTTLELVGTIISQASAGQLWLLATSRPEFQPSWPASLAVQRLELEPLTRSEALQMVESSTHGALPPPAVMQEILEKGDGVPLFLEQVAQFITDAPLGAGVPDNLQELLSARIDLLPDDTAATLRVAAILGRRSADDLLRAVVGKSGDAVDRDLARLAAAGVLSHEADGYAFRHALLQEAAYDRIRISLRRELHEKIAATITTQFPQLAETQPELIAHHLSEAGAHAEAREAWTRAGTRHLRHGAFTEAARHFQRAIDALERSAAATATTPVELAHAQLRLRKDLGVSLIATQGYASAPMTDNNNRALEAFRVLGGADSNIPLHVLYGLWTTYLVRGDLHATNELVPHFERARGSANRLERHIAYSTLAVHAFYRGRLRRALDLCREGIALYDASQHYVLVRKYGYEGGLYPHSYGAVAACMLGLPDEGLAMIERAIVIADGIGDTYGRALTLGLAAALARERGEPERAIGYSDRLIELATEKQFYFWIGIGHCFHGWATVALGDAVAGTDEVRLGLQIWGATGASVPGTSLRRLLVEALLASGQPAQALAEIDRGLVQCEATIECFQKPEYLRLRAEWLAGTGDLAAARECLAQAWQGACAQAAVPAQLRIATASLRLNLPFDEVAPAQRLEEVFERLPEGATLPDAVAARALA